MDLKELALGSYLFIELFDLKGQFTTYQLGVFLNSDEKGTFIFQDCETCRFGYEFTIGTDNTQKTLDSLNKFNAPKFIRNQVISELLK